jgi:hypothetical protein
VGGGNGELRVHYAYVRKMMIDALLGNACLPVLYTVHDGIEFYTAKVLLLFLLFAVRGV